MWRDAFRYVLQPEAFLDAENVRALLAKVGFLSVTELGEEVDLVKLALDIAAEASEAEMSWCSLLDSAPEPAFGLELQRKVLLHTAPLAASLGVWLQGLSAPSVFEDDTTLKTLALFADDVGVGRPGRSRAHAHQQVSRTVGADIDASQPYCLANERLIADGAFAFPTVLFALSRRSDAFGPELMGVDFAMREVGLLPCWRAISKKLLSPEWSRLDLSLRNVEALPLGYTPKRVSEIIIYRFQDDPILFQRLLQGVHIARAGLQFTHAEVVRQCQAFLDPSLGVAMLFQERAREASVYHGHVALEGRPLSEWFREAAQDPLPLVEALGRSGLVEPGDPANSTLLGALVGPAGPMFRIFSRDELSLLRRWIETLPTRGTGRPTLRSDARVALLPAVPSISSIHFGNQHIGQTPGSLREAFHLLQGRALAPRTRAFAFDYAIFWLRSAKQSIGASERSLPEMWQPGELRKWLLERHDRHDLEFRATNAEPPPTRAKLIDETVQLAPLTLIDGAWLQGFTELALASSKTGAPLFETYWDELGNGELSLNHPKIFRSLLVSMGVVLPQTGSREFAEDRRIRDESFRLPVYWLCMGKFPDSLRPEILGLNLAMELSGVGGGYRSARKFLVKHGFSPQFVDLHNAIDNVASGHSAWAADAIDAHLSSVGRNAEALDAEWNRIRAGFESLAPIVGRQSKLDYFARPRWSRWTASDRWQLGHAPLLRSERSEA